MSVYFCCCQIFQSDVSKLANRRVSFEKNLGSRASGVIQQIKERLRKARMDDDVEVNIETVTANVRGRPHLFVCLLTTTELHACVCDWIHIPSSGAVSSGA